MRQFKITIDESIPLDRAEEALRGLPYELCSRRIERASYSRARAKRCTRSLSHARLMPTKRSILRRLSQWSETIHATGGRQDSCTHTVENAATST